MYKVFTLPKSRVLTLNVGKSIRLVKTFILGIETSCDDTGCAIVNNKGKTLGEALHSQHQIHLDNGGIIPPIAQTLHRQHIENVVKKALINAEMHLNDVEAIAVTIKPGLPLSLEIGTKYGKYLCRKYHKPFIPIHHMEAHALTIRMIEDVKFPFLVLLISGGHCLLAIAQNVNKFLLLGNTFDDSPGEAFDKAARRMKLKNIPEFSQLSGGQAIELAASKSTDPLKFKFTIPLVQYRDCNFSLAGAKTQLMCHLLKEEKAHNIAPDQVIPNVYDLCAGFLLVITRHLSHRVQRGIIFAERRGLIPNDRKTLVVSGGAACNNFIAKGLQMVCTELGYQFARPPPQLCTDNGVMIAWNGVEKWKANIDIIYDYDSIVTAKTSPLGENITRAVIEENISCKWVRLNKLNDASAFK
ncbi:hypothetical protein Trydic_g22744 [Trypoxylus dichotomus]